MVCAEELIKGHRRELGGKAIADGGEEVSVMARVVLEEAEGRVDSLCHLRALLYRKEYTIRYNRIGRIQNTVGPTLYS